MNTVFRGISITTVGLITACGVGLLLFGSPPSYICSIADNDANVDVTFDALKKAGMQPIDCDIRNCSDETSIESAKENATAIRNFANPLPPSCAKTAYLGWADYVDRQANKSQTKLELATKIPVPPTPN